MDQLVSTITEKTGLPADKVQEVVGMVVDFIADKSLDRSATRLGASSTETAAGTTPAAV